MARTARRKAADKILTLFLCRTINVTAPDPLDAIQGMAAAADGADQDPDAKPSMTRFGLGHYRKRWPVAPA